MILLIQLSGTEFLILARFVRIFNMAIVNHSQTNHIYEVSRQSIDNGEPQGSLQQLLVLL